jgi:ABC-type multidrug transport system fused ATPase/permease subunit
VKGMNIPWYRSQLGLVSQEPNLFKGTIGENISYGTQKTSVTQEEIEHAAKSANAHVSMKEMFVCMCLTLSVLCSIFWF